jgi:hypothetical protein
MPISLISLNYNLKALIHVPQILKYGDFFALIKDLCMPFTHRKPGGTKFIKSDFRRFRNNLELFVF